MLNTLRSFLPSVDFLEGLNKVLFEGSSTLLTLRSFVSKVSHRKWVFTECFSLKVGPTLVHCSPVSLLLTYKQSLKTCPHSL